MKAIRIITAAVAATPTLTNGVASCPDGQFAPASPQPRVSSSNQPNNRIMSR